MSTGLAGVVAAESRLSHVDAENIRLLYCGYDVRELTHQSRFEEVAFLLWNGALPTSPQFARFRRRFRKHRSLNPLIEQWIKETANSAQPMAALRTAVSMLSQFDPAADDMTPEAHLNMALRITAKIPTIIAHYHRARIEEDPIIPNPDLNHAGNFLYMMHGREPTTEEIQALDRYLIMLAEHSLNASTFTVRVSASTLTDLYSAVTAGIGALKGPLHGGANRAAMEMLEDIEKLENVEPYLKQALAENRKVMGFGHRVYTKGDPRAYELKDIARDLCKDRDPNWFPIAEEVAKQMMAKKGIIPNVDFYSAPILQALGIPVDMFTQVFAMARVVGWSANYMEQLEDNKIIRPLAAYVGAPLRVYVPIGQR